MLVKCEYNLRQDLPTDLLDINKKDNYALVVGKHYVVYALTLFKGYVWYFLVEPEMYYPCAYPSPLFSVVDGRLSKYWVYAYEKEEKNYQRLIISFPEWAHNPYYYDQLTDHEEKYVKNFKDYKYKMDLEFPNPSIKIHAEKLDGKWLMCPLCIDAWESPSLEGMVICPSCKNTMHNPRFIS